MSDAPARCIVCHGEPLPARSGCARCAVCGLEWRDPLPDEEELRALYASGYHERWGLAQAGAFERVRAMKRATYADVLAEVRRHRRAGSLLDVGCALGFLVELAGESGFDAYGCDPSAQAVRFARERLGERVETGELSPALFPGRVFDVVTLIDVLEHALRPGRLLAAVRSRLAPQGLLVALLPNAASLSRRCLGRRWPHYAPEHLYHWSPDCLRRFLDAAGWRVLGLRTGFRKTYRASYLASYAATTAPWLVPLLRPLGHLRLRIGTGEMLLLATPYPAAASDAAPARAAHSRA